VSRARARIGECLVESVGMGVEPGSDRFRRADLDDHSIADHHGTGVGLASFMVWMRLAM